MMKFQSVLLSALALAAATAAQAAPAKVADGKLFKVVTEEDLKQLVLTEGHTVDEMHPFEAPSVRGKTADGLYLSFWRCCAASRLIRKKRAWSIWRAWRR